jgi:hypothetical protein
VGSLLEYAYFQFGVPAFSANLWSVREDAETKPGQKPGPGATGKAPAAPPAGNRAAMFRQAAARMAGGPGAGGGGPDPAAADEKWLSWIDGKNQGQGFLPWTPFQHPQLGEVEIGGFTPYLKLNPPAETIAGMIESHAEFALRLADEFAEIEMEAPRVEQLSSRAFELKVTVRNRGRMPYVTAMGRRARNRTPIVLQLKFSDDEGMSLFAGSKRADLDNLAAGEEKEFSWIIISPPGRTLDLSLWARHGGGKTRRTVTLK